MDTLAVRLAVPLIGPAKVSHLLGLRPAGRTKKRGAGRVRRLLGYEIIFANSLVLAVVIGISRRFDFRIDEHRQ